MLVVSVVMYAVAATHWALTMAIVARRLRAGNVLTPSSSEALALIYVPAINVRCPLTTYHARMLIPVKYFLSDGIVLWRAWVLWNRRFILFVPPVIFLLCTLGERHQITRQMFSI